MSNQTVNNENRFNRSTTIQNKQTSTTERVKVNSLLQRVANGQAGVVLEELFWETMEEGRSGSSWKSVNQALERTFYQIEYIVCEGLVHRPHFNNPYKLWGTNNSEQPHAKNRTLRFKGESKT